MTVTEFLIARIAEDEAAAGRTVEETADDGAALAGDRILADARAKRTILALHEGSVDIWGFAGCLTCGNVADTTAGYPCPTVRALAGVYADHPDFDPAWRSGT